MLSLLFLSTPHLLKSSDGSTAIHLAAFVGAVSLIELMLMNGADPDIRDFDGRLPIHWGTTPRSPKCIDILMKVSACTGHMTPLPDHMIPPLGHMTYHMTPPLGHMTYHMIPPLDHMMYHMVPPPLPPPSTPTWT